MDKLRAYLRSRSLGVNEAGGKMKQRACLARHAWQAVGPVGPGAMGPMSYLTPSHSRKQPCPTCALGGELRT